MEESTKTISVYTYPPTAYFSVYHIQGGGFVPAKTPHIRFNGSKVNYAVKATDLTYADEIMIVTFDPNSAVISIPVVSVCGRTNVHVVKTEDLSGDQATLPTADVSAANSKFAVFAGYQPQNTTFKSTYWHFEFTSPYAVQYLGKTDNLDADEYLIPINLMIDGYV